ncbi:MAG: RuBisCO large subunit C-terminal-like domain-containing protein [Candidatus Latescibacterota bacterium]
MKNPDSRTIAMLNDNPDTREDIIRTIVYESLETLEKPDLSKHIAVSYFVCAKTLSPYKVGREIAYHMTSGVRNPPQGSLLARCNGEVLDEIVLDVSKKVGIVRVAFPLEMLADESGNLYTTDILHIAAGEGVFGLTENSDIKLVKVEMSDETLRLFPGPAYGARGVRKITGFGDDETAFGTILKPCTGITPSEEYDIIRQAVSNPMFLFVKEDENFLPGVAFAPLRERLKSAVKALKDGINGRNGKGIVFAPHITSNPETFRENVRIAVDSGVNGVMLSEYFTGGSYRLVREMTKKLASPPAIYGHNGGISVRTRHIYREVLDLFARLDGVDFRQTAPLTKGDGLLRPYGLEWRECEKILSSPLAGIPAVMMARAGGLDQGNIIPNLLDVTGAAGLKNYLFLAGSAINGIKNKEGSFDPSLGAEAMKQALEVFEMKLFDSVDTYTVEDLKSIAVSKGFYALKAALAQRYPDS